MIYKKLITSFTLCVALAVSVYGQENSTKAPLKTLKEAYAGKFLIGCADDLTQNDEAYQESIRKQYDIVTPENCMKPQPIHPSEDTYNFKTTDAMVEWCEKNGLKVWGHTLGWHSQTAPWFFQEKQKKSKKGDAAKSATTTAAPAPPAPPAPGTPPGQGMAPNGPRPNFGGFGGFGANSGPQASRKVVLKRLEKLNSIS